jgi:exo-beta-1,3-glucanase (GH17 family)
MKHFWIFALLVFALLLSSCVQNSNKDQSAAPNNFNIEEIKLQLESSDDLETQYPFISREFIPFSEANPIERAVSYGCYREGQAPWGPGPSKEQIAEDLSIISKYWNLIRVYNADDDTEHILEMIEENNFPIKVMLGVWLENETDKSEKKVTNIANILRCLELTQKFPKIISAVNVGNETQVFWSWHKMDSKDLIRYIRTIRNNTTLPITTADDYNFWNKTESKTVASEIDFITTHIHPLWNGKTLATAIPWTDKTIDIVKTNHTEKLVVLGEIGWATNYNVNKKGEGQQGTLIKGEVGIQAQEDFLNQLDNWIVSNNITTFLFEAYDESWKGGADQTEANEVEKNWGVFYEDRTPKRSFDNFLIYKQKSKNKSLRRK